MSTSEITQMFNLLFNECEAKTLQSFLSPKRDSLTVTAVSVNQRETVHFGSKCCINATSRRQHGFSLFNNIWWFPLWPLTLVWDSYFSYSASVCRSVEATAFLSSQRRHENICKNTSHTLTSGIYEQSHSVFLHKHSLNNIKVNLNQHMKINIYEANWSLPMLVFFFFLTMSFY